MSFSRIAFPYSPAPAPLGCTPGRRPRPRGLEPLDWKGGIGDPDRAAPQLDAVVHCVVVQRPNSLIVARPKLLEVVRVRRRKRVMSKDPGPGLWIALEEGKVLNPYEGVPQRRLRFEPLDQRPTDLAQRGRGYPIGSPRPH